MRQYRSTQQLVADLERHGFLIRVSTEVKAHLEIAEIHRRVFQNQGPALLFTNVRGCQFPVATNLFGTLERAQFIFRHTYETVKLAVRWKSHPHEAFQNPLNLARGAQVGWNMRPRIARSGPVLECPCQVSHLPQVTCWPEDGGAFITLPQVLSQIPGEQALSGLNLGMYRVQLSGNQYVDNQECGLHYQLHRGIGVHHQRAIQLGADFPVTVSVGGTPAMTLAAVMPLPEGMSELGFAGALAGHRIPLVVQRNKAPIYADADFCIVGKVIPSTLKPEGPFGDHLGYYARIHDFPVLHVDKVYHRKGAVWPMTVVGRPPQEDTIFGQLIHDLTEPVIPSVLPGVRQVHAVDAAGVHPLLLAVGSERYTPYCKPQQPQELLTQACAILGQGQLSLAKYLWIVDGTVPAAPNARDIPSFFEFVMRYADWQRDLHFHTCTTMDTLDYSGEGLNQGSKLVVAVSGAGRGRELPGGIEQLSEITGWQRPRVVQPGILVVEGMRHCGLESQVALAGLCDGIPLEHPVNRFPLVVVVDDSDFVSRSLENFLWVAFTRSNPARDVYGVAAFIENKHFGCRGSLVIDARIKPHHAPPLIEDRAVSERVDALALSLPELGRYL